MALFSRKNIKSNPYGLTKDDLKEDIEDFFEDEDDDKYEYTYDLLEAIYEYIIYETDKNRINKNIDDVMQRMQNNGERIEQEVE